MGVAAPRNRHAMAPPCNEACSKFLGDFEMDDLLRVLATLRQWRQRTRSRRELAGLDDYQLRDFGVSRSQAQFESGKRFWQA